MSESQRLRIDIDRPESGWLKVEMNSGDQKYGFYPSHVPYDSVSELVNALLKILDAYDKAMVRLMGKPSSESQSSFKRWLEKRAAVS